MPRLNRVILFDSRHYNGISTVQRLLTPLSAAGEVWSQWSRGAGKSAFRTDRVLRVFPSFTISRAVPLLRGGLRAGRRAGMSMLATLLIMAGLAQPGWSRPAPGATPLAQASNLIEWGRWKEARDRLTEALRQSPQSPELMAYQAHVFVGFGDDDAALDLAQQAVKLDGQCAICHLYLGEAMGERAKHMNRFRAVIQLHHIRKELETALQLAPKNGDVRWGWINFDLDVPAAVGGSPTDAARHADVLERIDPVDGHIAHATIDLATGHPKEAMAEYQKSAHDYPNDPRGNFYVGLTLFQEGQFTAAQPYLDKARTLQPQSALYIGYYAANLVHLRHQEQARAVITAALRRFPNSRLGDYLVAQALHAIGQNFDWARQLLTSYLAVPAEPDQPTHADAQQLLSALG